jgi:hypothetical protein
VASHSSNSIIKFADDTTVVGLITNNDETAYREEVGTLMEWCQVNNLSLNVSKTKEIIMNYRRNQAGHNPSSTGPLWRPHRHRGEEGPTATLQPQEAEKMWAVPKGPQYSTGAPLRAYWYGNSTAADCKALQMVVCSAKRTIGCMLSAIRDIYNTRCRRTSNNIKRTSATACSPSSITQTQAV